MRVLKTKAVWLTGVILLCVCLVARAQETIWVCGYLPGWTQKSSVMGGGRLPLDEIDYDALTHIMHFSVVPKTDGSLDYDVSALSPDRIADAVAAAHAHDKPILLTVGGWGTYTGFSGAIQPATRGTLVANLVQAMEDNGYDGLDIDMEPIEDSDKDDYKAFINELHTQLQGKATPLLSRPLLTAAVMTDDVNWFAELQDKFDQMNLMTYQMSGAWPGWVTWHSGPLYNGGATFPDGVTPLPCADGLVDSFIAAGASQGKVGIGIGFFGRLWKAGDGTSTGGATEPRQSWTTAPTTEDVLYYAIMESYYEEQYYRWDDAAQNAYLSMDLAGSAADRFLSYEDESTCRKKIEYVFNKGIGGAIIWELSAGYLEGAPAGQRDPLLQAVKSAVAQNSPVYYPKKSRGCSCSVANQTPREAAGFLLPLAILLCALFLKKHLAGTQSASTPAASTARASSRATKSPSSNASKRD